MDWDQKGTGLQECKYKNCQPKSSCFCDLEAKINQIIWWKKSLKCLEWAIWRCSDEYWSGWASILMLEEASCFSSFKAKIKQILWWKTSLKCLEWSIWRCSDGKASILMLVEVLSCQNRRPKLSCFSGFEAKIKQILWWKTSLKCLAWALWHWSDGYWSG